MRDRALNALGTGMLAAVGAALLLSGCNSTGGGGGGDGGTGRYPRTQPGEKFLSGQLVLDEVRPPSASRPQAEFVVRNLSGKPMEQLTATVLFYSPSTGGIQEYDSEAHEHRFNVYTGESVVIPATPSNPAAVQGWEIRIQAGRTVAAGGGTRGSMFLDGDLECVAIEDRLTDMHPSIRFTIGNVSGEPQGQLEFQVILRKGGRIVHETPWHGVPGTVPPGGRVELVPDLGGVDVGAAEAELRLRRMIL